MTSMYATLNNGTPDLLQQTVDIVVVGGDAAGGSTPAWDNITNKPDTFPPTIGTTSTTAVAGSDPRLTAGAAGTATVRAIGSTATTAAAGNHTHTGLLTGSATTINNAPEFTDLATATAAYNTLLAALRTRGIITGA